MKNIQSMDRSNSINQASSNYKSIKSLLTTKKNIPISNILETSLKRLSHQRVKTDELSFKKQISTGVATIMTNATAMSSCYINTKDHHQKSSKSGNEKKIILYGKNHPKSHLNNHKSKSNLRSQSYYINNHKTSKCNQKLIEESQRSSSKYQRNKHQHTISMYQNNNNNIVQIKQKLKRKKQHKENTVRNHSSIEEYLIDTLNNLNDSLIGTNYQSEKNLSKNIQIKQEIEKQQNFQNNNFLTAVKAYNDYTFNLQSILLNQQDRIKQLQTQKLKNEIQSHTKDEKLVKKYKQLTKINSIYLETINILKKKGIDVDSILKQHLKDSRSD